jgi:hypothetical protein
MDRKKGGHARPAFIPARSEQPSCSAVLIEERRPVFEQRYAAWRLSQSLQTGYAA